MSGNINVDDVFAVTQISIDVGEWDDDQLYAADVVGSADGNINVDDVFAILQTSIDVDVEFKN